MTDDGKTNDGPIAAFSKKILDALVGTRWGAVSPPHRNPPRPLPVDGRTVALSLLRRYISDLTFFRHGAYNQKLEKDGEPDGFSIPRERIFVEWPDDETLLQPPSITFLQEEDGKYPPIGLNFYVDEATVNKYGQDTVVQWQSEYDETFVLEIHASSRAERRSIISGLEIAMNPVEEYAGLRMIMRDYYGQPAVFSLDRRRLIDDASSSQNRREARMFINMRYTVCQLVSTVTMIPVQNVCVDGDPA